MRAGGCHQGWHGGAEKPLGLCRDLTLEKGRETERGAGAGAQSTWATPSPESHGHLPAQSHGHRGPWCPAGGSEGTVPWDAGTSGGRERHLLPQAPWQHFWWRGHCRLLSHAFGGLGLAQVMRTCGQDQAVPAR